MIKLISIILLCWTAPAYQQFNSIITDSINRFSLRLLASVNNEGGDNLNIALTPLTLWTSLTVVREGARESTAIEIDRALNQPNNKTIVRESYAKIYKSLIIDSKDVEFQTSTGLFSRSNFKIKEQFATTIRQYYNVDIQPVDFEGNSKQAALTINKFVATATKNRIPQLVFPGDVENAYVFLTSTLYFKGKWQVPFNKSATQRDTFYDDKKMKIGDVQLMYQAHPYPYVRFDRAKADIVELPYGDDKTFSMLVFVPRGHQTVNNMINELVDQSITDILDMLAKNHENFVDEDIHLYLPKFKVTSDFNMERVLEKMGIRDVFSPAKANLLGIFDHYLYISRVIQKAEIEVDEDGSVASGASGSIFLNRAPPPVVKANRPFAYFIVHKPSGTIIFNGKVSNPKELSF